MDSFGEGVWWALSLVTTAAVASLFVREDEAPVELREAAFEAELRALRTRLDRLETAVRGGAAADELDHPHRARVINPGERRER